MKHPGRQLLNLTFSLLLPAVCVVVQGPPAPAAAASSSRTSTTREEKFVSLQGHFSIGLSAQVQSYRAVGFKVSEGRVEGDAYGWRTEDGEYELTYLNLPAALANKGVLDRTRDNMLAVNPKARLISEKELRLAGASLGRELRFETPEGPLVVRTFLAGSRMYEATVKPSKGREEAAVRVLDSLRLLSEAEVNAARRREAAATEPEPLPQTPVTPRPQSDAQEEGLRGRVKTVFRESEDLSGTWDVGGRKPSSEEEYDERGNLKRRVFYDSKGNLSDVRAFGYVGGERVSNIKFVHHEYDPPPMMVAADGARRKPDPRYTDMYKYKYDTSGRLVEMATYTNDGELTTRYVYKYDGDTREESVYTQDGKLNSRYLSTYDARGNETEWVVYETRDGSVRERYSYAYEFDAKGNWVKRTASKWVTKDGKSFFEPSYLTYRTITYY